MRKAHQAVATGSLMATWPYRTLQPIPLGGFTNLMHAHRALGALIRLVPVICQTANGSTARPVKKAAVVEHKQGGGPMLPHLEMRERSTPHDSVCYGLMHELKIPEQQLAHVNQSSVIFGWHLHAIPASRLKHVTLAGTEVKKLLVFLKICVNEDFNMTHDDFKHWGWVTTLDGARHAMRNMRDRDKYDAEVEAVAHATGW